MLAKSLSGHWMFESTGVFESTSESKATFRNLGMDKIAVTLVASVGILAETREDEIEGDDFIHSLGLFFHVVLLLVSIAEFQFSIARD